MGCERRAVLAAWAVTVIMMLPAHAQSLFDFDVWMEKIEKRSLSLQRALEAGDVGAAGAHGAEMRDLYAKMEQYFIAKGIDHGAVVLAREGIAQLDQVTRSARRGDLDSALAAARTVARACRDCHLKYKPLR
jgi:soluble cytochrome b562